MELALPQLNFSAIMPETVLSVVAMALLLINVLVKGKEKAYLGYLSLAGLVLSLFMLPASGAEPKAVSLADLLKFQTKHPGERRASVPLAPEWIGMIRRTHVVGDDHGVYKDPENPMPVRLNYGGIELHGTKKKTADIIVVAARRTTDGSLSYQGDHRAVYRESLPAAEEIANTKSLDKLRDWFGPQFGISDGWGGGPEGIHSTAGWTFVSPSTDGNLHYLSIFAHVHGRRGEPAVVDILALRQADLRPAVKGSPEETRQFPSTEEFHRREIIEQKEKQQAFPRPLRDLLAASEAPDDSDLVAYRSFVNRFRDNPDPLLLSQLVAHAHEDTVDFRMMLEALMLNDHFLGTKRWNPAKRKKALGFLIDAFTETKANDALFDACIVALKCLGGGKLQLTAGDSSIDLEVTLEKNGESVSGDYPGHSPALIRDIQKELRRRLDAAKQ